MSRKRLWKHSCLLLILTFLLSSASFTFAAGGNEAEETALEEIPGPALEGRGLAPMSEEKVYFRGWQYKTHIVKDNVNRYNHELNGRVDYATITGDYPSIMETQFIADAPLDILYANPSQACRYYDGGWILPAEELPMIDKIKADMYSNIRDAWTYRGKLLGLSYFVTVRGVIHVNLKKLQELGISEAELPANWDELWDFLLVLRDRGAKFPFLPHWFNEWHGMSWGFAFEVLNRGGKVADPDNHRPLLTADGAAGETLRDWKRAWNAGLIPKEVVQYLESDYMEAWGSGEYVMSPQQMYDFKRFNEERYSNIAGYDVPLPYKGQSWGLIDSAIYLMSNRPRDPAHTRDVMAFDLWYGYRDHEDRLHVPQRWMEESMLFTAYRPVMESPENKALMQQFFARPQDYDTALEVYAHTPYPKGIWNVVWAPEFNSWLKEQLMLFLLENKSVEETVAAIRHKIEELNDLYGVQ